MGIYTLEQVREKNLEFLFNLDKKIDYSEKIKITIALFEKM